MQIDFHHAVTYVSARLAGFKHKDANIIAYSAQYVDDATNAGLVRFDNGAMYKRIASAHKMLDYRNSKALSNHQVWIPFHFLPGNDGLPAGENPEGSFINKLICRPDSPVARDMIRGCIGERDKAYALYRLGIAMHVYADTWAHQGFAGVNHKVNDADNIKSNLDGQDKRLGERLLNFFIGEALPLGHGTVLSYPDRPYLIWEYRNGLKQKVKRDNPTDFLQAADRMCRAMRCYVEGDAEADLDAVEGLPQADSQRIAQMLGSIKKEDGGDRHKLWLQAVREGKFSFGPANVGYTPKGVGSWKYKAIGTKEWTDDDYEAFKYTPAFLASDWKMFHDALQAHRFSILHEVLPRYGICAA